MKCQDLHKELGIYLLGDITGRKAEEFKAHLAECAECRALEEGMLKSLKAVRDLPVLPPSPARVKGVLKAAARESGPLARRPWVPLVLGAAAACLLALVLGGILLPGTDTGVPDTKPEVIDRPGPPVQPPSPPVGNIAMAKGSPDRMEVRRPEVGDSFPLKKGLELWVGDEFVSHDDKAEFRIQFYRDAMRLTVTGRARFRITGRDNDHYGIALDEGTVTGHFPQPVEALQDRQGAFVVDTPVGLTEVLKGQGFTATQNKVTLWPQSWTNMPGGTFSIYFKDFDLSTFVSTHLQRNFQNRVVYNPRDLQGKKISLLCNRCPRDLFMDRFDQELASKGLTIRRDAGNFLLEKAERRSRGGDPWKDLTYGELVVSLEGGGEAKISRKDGRPGAIMIHSGQEGRLRPREITRDAKGGQERLPGVVEVRNMALKGTYLGPERHGALVLVSKGTGTDQRLILSPGDKVGGHRVSWIGWDRVILEKDGQEFELTIQKK